MKSFKSVVFLLCFGLIVSNISFGQSGTQSKSGDYKQVMESLQLNNKVGNKINDVSLYFCNSGLEYKDLTTFLEIDMRPGETREICTIFANKSDNELGIIESFTDGRKEKPDDKVYSILCSVDITGKNDFSNLIKGKNSSEFNLSGKELKVKKTIIKIPRNATGSILSCRMFKIKGNLQKAASGSMFNIEVVKKMPFQINITGEVYNGGLNSITYYITDNKENILKGFIAIVGLRLIVSIIQSSSKKKHNQHHKK